MPNRLLKALIISRFVLISAALLATGACAEDVPADPTWFGEVQGILAANCLRCHSAPSKDPGNDHFRLDRFVAGDDPDADLSDAFDMASLILDRSVDFKATGNTQMPPDSSLSDRQRTILERWVANGTPKGTRSNQAPEVEIFAPSQAPAMVDQTFDVAFRSFDGDNDGLVTKIGYRPAGTSGPDSLQFFDLNLVGSRFDITLDAGLLTSKSRFDIVAVVDDGHSDTPSDNQTEILLFGDLLADHGVCGTAPTVRVVAPNVSTALPSGAATDIVWTASDPDAGELPTIRLDLVRLDASGAEVSTTSIATGLGSSSSPYSWNPAGVEVLDGSGNLILYKVRVTASDVASGNDGCNTIRSDDSDAAFSFVPMGGSTELSWTDVKPFFVTYCGDCHGQPPSIPKNDSFRLDKYDAADTEAPTNNDEGVFEQQFDVYAVLFGGGKAMPPAMSLQPDPLNDLPPIKEWLEAGAPFGGGGGGDGLPTFVWMTPNNSATSPGTATTTIGWSVSDPEGLPMAGSIEMAELPNPGMPPLMTNSATCTGNEPGYTEVVASANIEDGSADINFPNTGFFCFKGEVTDDFGQTVNVLATRPIEF